MDALSVTSFSSKHAKLVLQSRIACGWCATEKKEVSLHFSRQPIIFIIYQCKMYPFIVICCIFSVTYDELEPNQELLILVVNP
jgi:hypothetical protein